MNALPVALAGCLALSLTSLAEAKQSKRHKHAEPAPAADPWRASGVSRQPARMIEAKPGYWISSYGCVQDGGYGRLTPCDFTYSSR
jgi:hypothetical protein